MVLSYPLYGNFSTVFSHRVVRKYIKDVVNKNQVIFCKNIYQKKLFYPLISEVAYQNIVKEEPRKKLPNKKIIKTAKFEAKEQFTKSSLENLKTENERLIKNLIDSGEFKPKI